MLATRVRKDCYFDSVMLMSISSKLREVPGVLEAAVAMGTPANLEWLGGAGLIPAENPPRVSPADLIVAVEAEEEVAAQRAFDELDRLLSGRGSGGADTEEGMRFRSISQATAATAGANVALVSVPGPYARLQAEEALRAGLHVMVFSDNVPAEDELALKRLASGLGLLVMGPDCGTAIIGGRGLGFANRVRRGDIGIVGASGTGTQEVSCLLDAMGAGLSHAIGTGSHDLSEQIGGLTFISAIRAFGATNDTRVLVLISKPPARAVAEAVLEAAVATGKPVVACFLGTDLGSTFGPSVYGVATLEEAAIVATRLSLGQDPQWPLQGDVEAACAVRNRIAELGPLSGRLRGLFCGGTLCTESQLVLSRHLGPVFSNASFSPDLKWTPGSVIPEHLVVDLGDDYYTVGRPHPMMDGSQRLRELEAALEDETTGLVLLDVILGAGAECDPAGPIARLLTRSGSDVPVVISFCATESDPQGFAEQHRQLKEAGAYLFRSNAAAARAAAALMLGDSKILQEGD